MTMEAYTWLCFKLVIDVVVQQRMQNIVEANAGYETK